MQSYIDFEAIVPVGNITDGSCDEFMVPESEVSNGALPYKGIDIPSRPLKYGVVIDLLAISHTDELQEKGLISEFDVIDVPAYVGKHWFLLQYKGKTAVLTADLTKDQYELTDAAKGTCSYDYEHVLRITAGNLPDSIDFASDLGISEDSEWYLDVTVVVRSDLNLNTGTVNAVLELELSDFIVLGPEKFSGVKKHTNLKNPITVKPLGYYPMVKRVNTNLR